MTWEEEVVVDGDTEGAAVHIVCAQCNFAFVSLVPGETSDRRRRVMLGR